MQIKEVILQRNRPQFPLHLLKEEKIKKMSAKGDTVQVTGATKQVLAVI